MCGRPVCASVAGLELAQHAKFGAAILVTLGFVIFERRTQADSIHEEMFSLLIASSFCSGGSPAFCVRKSIPLVRNPTSCQYGWSGILDGRPFEIAECKHDGRWSSTDQSPMTVSFRRFLRRVVTNPPLLGLAGSGISVLLAFGPAGTMGRRIIHARDSTPISPAHRIDRRQ